MKNLCRAGYHLGEAILVDSRSLLHTQQWGPKLLVKLGSWHADHLALVVVKPPLKDNQPIPTTIGFRPYETCLCFSAVFWAEQYTRVKRRSTLRQTRITEVWVVPLYKNPRWSMVKYGKVSCKWIWNHRSRWNEVVGDPWVHKPPYLMVTQQLLSWLKLNWRWFINSCLYHR